jgi:hypothetical protein
VIDVPRGAYDDRFHFGNSSLALSFWLCRSALTRSGQTFHFFFACLSKILISNGLRDRDPA